VTLSQVLLHVMNMNQPEPIPSAGSGRVSPDRSRVFRLLKLPLKPTAFSSKIPNKRYGGEGRNRPFSVAFASLICLISLTIQHYSALSVLIGFYSFGVRFGVRSRGL